MSTSRRPYFMPLFVGGASVGFAHLEPFQLSMTTQARPEGLVLDVRFSNHCFSEAYDPALHQSSVDVWDRGVRRVFCPVRYQFSKALPNIVQGLPQAHVFMTPESNYVRISTRNDGGTGEYRMFFNVKRAAMGQGHDIKLFVESAYAPEPNQALSPGQMTRVRFAVLIDKTIKGERVKFHHKR